jgi:hypothetical protein
LREGTLHLLQLTELTVVLHIRYQRVIQHIVVMAPQQDKLAELFIFSNDINHERYPPISKEFTAKISIYSLPKERVN